MTRSSPFSTHGKSASARKWHAIFSTDDEVFDIEQVRLARRDHGIRFRSHHISQDRSWSCLWKNEIKVRLFVSENKRYPSKCLFNMTYFLEEGPRKKAHRLSTLSSYMRHTRTGLYTRFKTQFWKSNLARVGRTNHVVITEFRSHSSQSSRAKRQQRSCRNDKPV